jgi:CBS domain containing-hemolysin-like protein
MTGKSMVRSRFTIARAAAGRLVAAALLSAAATPAFASFLSGEALDTAASAIAWFVVCVVPIVVIVLFWMVHVLPEKIAMKRHHPQKDAIHTLCLLSLVFGGLLWPFAWLWAYTKPVGYRLAYGTEKHDNYYLDMGERAKSGALVQEDVIHLRQELDAMAAKGTLPATLRTLRNELDALPVEATVGVKAGAA